MINSSSEQISIGKSPDRLKNLSVYNIGPSKSPYLPNGSLIPTQKADTLPSNGRNTSIDGAILQIDQLKSTSKSISGQKQAVHARTKSTADSMPTKMTTAQNFQHKINENNQLMKNIGYSQQYMQ